MVSVVIDNGTLLSKVGFNDDDFPRLITPTTIGENIQPSIVKKGGMIIDFEQLSTFWDICFKSLEVDASESSIFLSEAPFLPLSNRQSKADILFDQYHVQSIFTSPEGILPLYSCGEVTGTVLECGAGHCHVTSTYDGRIIPTSVARYELSGNDLTKYFTDLIEIQHGCIFKSSYKNIQNEMKESLCYVAQDYEAECILASSFNILEESFKFPDGCSITINHERFQVPESMFQPALAYKDMPGIHHMIHHSIMESAIDTRRSLCQHIILSGGSSMFPGIEHRLLKELKSLFPSNMDINIHASPDRHLGVWIGGAVLSSLSSFQASWITKAAYQEIGSSILYKDR